MADRPLIFSAPMVRALLAGRKTQTRRIIEVPDRPAMDDWVHEPTHAAPYLDAYCGEGKTAGNPRGLSDHWCWWTRDDRCGPQFKVGFAPGDRLWVREAWAPLDALTHNDPGASALFHRCFYRADEGTVDGEISRWRPSIHMPRWASRLTLDVTDVRVQRLQDISEEDAKAEGLAKAPGGWWSGAEGQAGDTPRSAFAVLWNSLHRPGAWAANPWVAALTFTVRRGNIDAVDRAPGTFIAAAESVGMPA